MNYRIIQLITEADTHAWSVAEKYVARDCCNDGEVNYLWEDAFREKFAELIVQECLKIVEPDQTSGDEWCVTLDETAQSIRQHFGLELNDDTR
jgi:hypothetical protein